ncbi:hypothetical protein [Bacillus kwashiorkori]|uniref:hypothetical protein n=1 Tax=Bacillus kwashiorkori TaxID=1522318 RepID=UPI000784A43E|nr:hypothetical protein [Bacillus kwashiorkori]
MYRETCDFEKISRAIENTLNQLKNETVEEIPAYSLLKEAEMNLQQAINFSLSSPVTRRTIINNIPMEDTQI